MGGNHLDTNQSDEMSASEQDSIEAERQAAEYGSGGIPGGAADVEAETPPDSPAGATAGPETPRGAEAPGGGRDADPEERQFGDSRDDLDAEAAEWAIKRDPGQEEAEELRAERDRIRDRHLRLAADFDNYRKRTEDRLRQRWNRAQADLISRLLEPLDDLLRVTALEPGKASVEAIAAGVDLVERKFFRVLEEAGVEVVDPQGEPFDPNTMEAMMSVPAGSDDEDDMVERVFQRGYTFRGQLVRPARVSVFKA